MELLDMVFKKYLYTRAGEKLNMKGFYILLSVKKHQELPGSNRQVFFFSKGKLNYCMKSNLGLLLHTCFYILFAIFFCALFFLQDLFYTLAFITWC